MAVVNTGIVRTLLGRMEPRYFRRALLWLLTVPAALAVAAATMIVTVNPDDVRRAIEMEVKQLTGLTMTAADPVTLRLWPSPAIIGGAIRVTNLTGTAAPSLLTAEGFTVELGVLRLFTGRARATRLNLSAPHLFLEVGKNGSRNWLFSKGSLDAVKIEDASLPDAPAVPSVVQIGLQNGRVTFTDLRDGQVQNIKVDQFDLSATDLPGFMALTVVGSYNEEALKVTGFVSTLDKLVWGGRGFSMLTEIEAFASAIRLRGNIGRPGFSNLLRLGISATGPDIQVSLNRIKAQVPVLAGMTLPVNGAYRVATRLRGPADSFSARGIDASLGQEGSLQIDITGGISRVMTRRQLNLTVMMKGPDVRKFSHWTGLSLPKLPPFEVSGVLRGAKGRYAVDNLEGRIGRSAFIGNLSADIRDQRPKISGAVNASLIDLVEIAGALDPDQALVAELSKLELDLKLVGKKVATGPVSMTNVIAGLVIQDGALKANPLVASLDGGRLVGTAALSPGTRRSKLNADLATKGINLIELGRSLRLKDDQLLSLRHCQNVRITGEIGPGNIVVDVQPGADCGTDEKSKM